ncbi:hypothetical protein KJ840_02500 [Patescibacteria group bacterium]|nr:hypothetical protein [Patescibacteria group bacterium]
MKLKTTGQENCRLSSKPRPYWRINAKWITGILLFFVLGLTLLFYNLVQITSEQPAVEAVTTALALSFSPQGLDNETDVNLFIQQLRKSPDGRLQPIPGLKIIVEESAIAGLSPREMRLYLFRQIAEPLYWQGPEGVIALADDSAMQQKLTEGIGPISIITLKTHQTFNKIFIVLLIISLALFLPLVFFSNRFGRLASPGFIILAASLPGTVIFNFISIILQSNDINQPPIEAGGLSGMIGYIAANALPPIVSIIARNYLFFSILGLGLILLAVAGKIIWRLCQRKADQKVNIKPSTQA